jgi:hypothetical protein
MGIEATLSGFVKMTKFICFNDTFQALIRNIYSGSTFRLAYRS